MSSTLMLSPGRMGISSRQETKLPTKKPSLDKYGDSLRTTDENLNVRIQDKPELLENEENSSLMGSEGEAGSSCFQQEEDATLRKSSKRPLVSAKKAQRSEEKKNESSVLVGSTGIPGQEYLETTKNFKELSGVNFSEGVKKKIVPPSLLTGSLPLVNTGHSLSPDLMFGWKPKIVSHGAPIPLYYDYQEFPEPCHPITNEPYPIVYYGPRPADTLELHKRYSEAGCPSGYPFTFPSNTNGAYAELAKTFGDQPIKNKNRGSKPSGDRDFDGMNPKYQDLESSLQFDSDFECGNLDMVAMLSEHQYDLYMRVDANTRGHHQWFYFSVKNKGCQTVRFNIVNFTKHQSLYTQGMRINAISEKRVRLNKQGEWMGPAASQYHFRSGHWRRSGTNIKYRSSKISRDFIRENRRAKKYYCLSFEYNFEYKNDTTYFAYCIPYTYTMLIKNIKDKMQDHVQKYPRSEERFIKQDVLCKSLSGIDVPLLTITSRVNESSANFMKKQDYQNSGRYPPPWNDDLLYKPSEREIVVKKVMVITGRVHPGESNGSWMMQGFLNFITGNSLNAQELRRRVVFKVIPMSNPDGVIIGNYRSSLSGNDLNRQYQDPDPRLHPTVIAIKELIENQKKQLYDRMPNQTQAQRRNYDEVEPIACFIDMHGHSRKKSAFMYGPYFPLHSQKYLRVRVIPKLMSERTEMFRYWACKFRVEKSKKRAARIVLWKQFGITNCYTIEASFHGFITSERKTVEFTHGSMEFMGREVAEALHEYLLILSEDERQKRLREYQLRQIKKRKAEIKREMMERRMALQKKSKKATASHHDSNVDPKDTTSNTLPLIPGAQSSTTAQETDKVKSRFARQLKRTLPSSPAGGSRQTSSKLVRSKTRPLESRESTKEDEQQKSFIQDPILRLEDDEDQELLKAQAEQDYISSSSESDSEEIKAEVEKTEEDEEEEEDEDKEKFPALAASFSVLSQQIIRKKRQTLQQTTLLTSNSSDSSLAINMAMVAGEAKLSQSMHRSQSVDANSIEGTNRVPSKFLIKAAKKISMKQSKDKLPQKASQAGEKKKGKKNASGQTTKKAANEGKTKKEKRKSKVNELKDSGADKGTHTRIASAGAALVEHTGQRGLRDIFKAVKRGQKLKREKQQQKLLPISRPKSKERGGYDKDDEGDGKISLRSSQDSFGRGSLSSQEEHRHRHSRDSSSDSSNSGGSDSDPEGDDLTAEELAELHGNMIQVIEKFNNFYNNAGGKKKGAKAKLNLRQDLKAGSATPAAAQNRGSKKLMKSKLVPNQGEKRVLVQDSSARKLGQSKELTRRQTYQNPPNFLYHNIQMVSTNFQEAMAPMPPPITPMIYKPLAQDPGQGRLGRSVYYVVNKPKPMPPSENMIIINQLQTTSQQEENEETDRLLQEEENAYLQHFGNQFKPKLNPKKARKSKAMAPGNIMVGSPFSKAPQPPPAPQPPQQKHSSSKVVTTDAISQQMAAAYHKSHLYAQGNFSLPKDHISNNSPSHIKRTIDNEGGPIGSKSEDIRGGRFHGISEMLSRLLEEKKFMRPEMAGQRAYTPKNPTDRQLHLREMREMNSVSGSGKKVDNFRDTIEIVQEGQSSYPYLNTRNSVEKRDLPIEYKGAGITNFSRRAIQPPSRGGSQYSKIGNFPINASNIQPGEGRLRTTMTNLKSGQPTIDRNAGTTVQKLQEMMASPKRFIESDQSKTKFMRMHAQQQQRLAKKFLNVRDSQSQNKNADQLSNAPERAVSYEPRLAKKTGDYKKQGSRVELEESKGRPPRKKSSDLKSDLSRVILAADGSTAAMLTDVLMKEPNSLKPAKNANRVQKLPSTRKFKK